MVLYHVFLSKMKSFWQNKIKYEVNWKKIMERKKSIVTLKSYNNKITTNFESNVKTNSTKQLKKLSKCICQSAIVIDSLFK